MKSPNCGKEISSAFASDKINDNGNYESKVFKFSFIQYFIRNLVYKILLLPLLFFAGKQVAKMAPDDNKPMIIFICTIVLEIILIILFLFQLATAFTQKVIAESGRIIYVYETPVFASEDEIDRMSAGEVWGMSHMHYIEIINEVIEQPNRILIRGSIKKQNQKYHHLGSTYYKETTVSKIKIPKYFKNNRELFQMLKSFSLR